jgi:hypothetical protein
MLHDNRDVAPLSPPIMMVQQSKGHNNVKYMGDCTAVQGQA